VTHARVTGAQDSITPTYGYIGGTSNCGSTLMSFLLNAQPGVASVGEVAWSIPRVNPGLFPCSCGARLDSCQFWSEVSREMQQRGHRFDADHWNTAFEVSDNSLLQRVAVRSLASNFADVLRDKLVHKLPGWGKELTEIGSRNAALAESIATITRASVFVDASKDPARVRLLCEYSDVQPYVIHLVRDAPAFVKSFIKKDPRKLQTAIRWWNRSIWQMERLKRTVPAERWLLLRYEDLCAEPEAELRRVLKFLGVDADAPILDYRSAPHHIIGNRMRLRDSSKIRLDTSWREELSGTQLDEIIANTVENRQRFGYS